ncbi:MAG: hypothetical protein MI725_08075 [Pirellulales bacterium]|nr:hypothetical protein [Pirellulales bacterium]
MTLVPFWTPLFCCLLSGAAEPQSTSRRPIPVLLDDMDGPQTALRLANPSSGLGIIHHAINQQHYRFGGGSEHVRLTCPAGTSAQLAYQVPPAPVIDELRISTSVMCNRPGVRLGATVVLPRSRNPATGMPMELLLLGGLADQAGNWQKLVLDDVAKAVQRQTRVARMQHGGNLDEREAYLSGVVLLAPGGQGITDLLVDRIEVYGVVRFDSTREVSSSTSAAGGHPTAGRPAGPVAQSKDQSESNSEALRIIQWQGEPLATLAQLGFDGVRMGRLPTQEESRQARQYGLSLICPPPTPQQLSAEGLGEEFSAVSVWELGEQLSPDELELAHRWQQLLKRHDPQENRPALISAQLYTREASRIADVVLLQRELLHSDLSMRDYSTWLTRHQRLTRPGTPIWTSVETQLGTDAAQQLAALCPAVAEETSASYAQIVAMTSAAFGAKCRGFCFQSHSSLAENDPGARRRALTLELVNIRLGLAKPWLTKGKLLAGARSTLPDLSALVFQVERSHLLVPVLWSDNLHSVEPSETQGPVSFVVPGVAESSEAYLLTMVGPQRLRHQRVTGGIRVSVDKLPHDAFLLLTDDQQAFSQVARYLRRKGPRAARIRRELVAMRLQDSVRVAQQLGSSVAVANQLQSQLGQAQRELQACDRHLLTGKNFELAYKQAMAAEQTLNRGERMLRAELDPPLAFGIATLPDQRRLQRFLSMASARENRLAGGGFEDLPAMLAAGWRHRQLPLEGVTTAVRLSPEAPHRGTYCLELEALPANEAASATMIPTAPVWITSAPISAKAGELVEITGFVRVPDALLGSVDGLQIIDSLGGAEMALRVPLARSWQPFRVLRAATADTEVTVTLALTGFGVAQVDDLQVRTVKLPSTNMIPQVAQVAESP